MGYLKRRTRWQRRYFDYEKRRNIRKTADRQGIIRTECNVQDSILGVLYGRCVGRMLVRPLVSPVFSRVGGKILSSGISKIAITPFVKKNGIDLSVCEKQRFSSYNDFFCRKLKEGERVCEMDSRCFVSPCDGKLTVYPITKRGQFQIKHTRYTLKELLRSENLAKKYEDGYLFLYRLSVEDYHRYIYVDDGVVSNERRIPGVFHTVNPVANDQIPIYKENTRTYGILESEHFGRLLTMEVGALLVGQIVNAPGERRVKRGEEKGHFAFGGSSIVILAEKGQVEPDADIVQNSKNGIETIVVQGMQVGRAARHF